MRRLWSRCYGKLLVIGAAAVVALAVASVAAASFTESDHFCGTACHEMGPYYETWQTSGHGDVDCVRCHIQPGTVQFVKAKVSALREVYVHFAGEVKAPIAVTRHVPDSTCESCHASGRGVDPITLGEKGAVEFSHRGHAEVGRLPRVPLAGRAPLGARQAVHRPREHGVLPALPRRRAGAGGLRALPPDAPRRPRPLHRLPSARLVDDHLQAPGGVGQAAPQADLREVPHAGGGDEHGVPGGLRQLSRKPPQRPQDDRVRALPHDDALCADDVLPSTGRAARASRRGAAAVPGVPHERVRRGELSLPRRQPAGGD